MANIYTKLTDKTLILAPREAVMRQFNFGTDWTEMRMGMFYCGVTAAGDNTLCVDEQVALSSNSDYITFGIKDSATTTLPGYAGSLYVGTLTRPDLTSNCRADGFFRSGTGGVLQAGAFAGVTKIGGTVTEPIDSMNFGVGAASATGYNGFYALKFVIANRGLSTQTISVSSSTSGGAVAGADYSVSALRTLMNNGTYNTPVSLAWNTGAAARTIPDCYFARLPFFNNRIRISAIRAIRYAP